MTSRGTGAGFIRAWAEDAVATSRGNGDDIPGSMSPSRYWRVVWMGAERHS